MPTPFPLAEVRLRPGPLRDAQQRGLQTILALRPRPAARPVPS
ncbi:hypothetical protein [Microbacterium invictum]|nr:hypothetical protein [Microbacterium invictum]